MYLLQAVSLLVLPNLIGFRHISAFFIRRVAVVIKAVTFVKIIAYNYIKDFWKHGHSFFGVYITLNIYNAEYAF